MREAHDTPPSTRGRQILLARIGLILSWVGVGVIFLWIMAMFQAIDADLQHPSSDDMLFAAMNLVLELLGIAVMSLAIASQPQILRQVGKALLALCFYVVVLAATYDTVAHLVPSHRIATLSEIAPGPVALWNLALPYVIIMNWLWILSLLFRPWLRMLRPYLRIRRSH